MCDMIKCSIKLANMILLLAMVLFCGSCRQQSHVPYVPKSKSLCWPEYPQEPRICYVGQIATEDDLGREISFPQALENAVFGRNKIGVLARPYGLTMDDQGGLYIADSIGSAVHVMNLTTRQYLQFSKLDDEKDLVSPIGLVVIGSKVYVADSILGEICVFDKQGRYEFSFGTERLKRPSGIAYSPRQQKVYVADTKLHSISVFDTGGAYLGEIGRGEGDHRYNFPTQLWVDHEDKLYICDTLNYRIHIISPERESVLTFGQHGDRPGCFAHPCGLATDSFGNIYVSDRQFENVQIFNRRGQILMAFGYEGNDEGEFWLPAGIYIDKNNRIYVADSFNRRIQIFQLLEGEKP